MQSGLHKYTGDVVLIQDVKVKKTQFSFVIPYVPRLTLFKLPTESSTARN